MSSLADKHIVLGISGGIAAYKSADLVRRLRERGAAVRVVMSAGAREFVQPLTYQALSGNPVHTDLLDPAAEAAMGHIELARWAELTLIAPASAQVMAKLACGMADDLLTTLCLASESPLALAPAMNQAMWRHPATVANAQTLRKRGVLFWGPAGGSQACGDVGPGRMLEPEELAQQAECLYTSSDCLNGKKVVVTSGPTREALDPVRYLSNHSSGKMGFALAAAARRAGAQVTLISGPVSLSTPAQVKRIDVVDAREMRDAAERAADLCDIFIGAAAVADFRPATAAGQKLKKQDCHDESSIALVKNPDIIAGIAARTTRRPFTVGFAAETQRVTQYAQSKLQRKNLDMIIANDVSRADGGFDSDQNAVTVIDRDGCQSLPLTLKTSLAKQLIEIIAAKAQHQ
ncbi:bifunctional phosphopantothenoylcysteine decarboxylase/phosphopantothenate--cysteine ligase CoaBC [Microbulbifer spongiae]|uniref:Coenzyme A biosynthesis bifunctional protein CoaBC n=1 Tax=Microbulbifer spongiae TaxID=2944933 RepID=A0ABY9EE37_9GAMM|nr:bifunctional phosphopantothenoylcysteine decarboxylase/phosphopantothenate--cysteine ligase CoaBC [Microbulbifer sp. MI-G]WKD49784.1 bifunctional phosphopantothenoylcysteine decarboxylase/phosphopantothenate--cysteine ligase CoaBC [Microbulbifer sp. MI-G]